MEVNSRTEFAIFFYTLHHPELVPKCHPSFFSDDTMRGLYEIASKFVLKYKECPTSEEMKQLIEASDWSIQQRQKITPDTVDLIWGDSDSYQTLYDPVWMTEQVEAFYRYQTLMKGVRETVSYVKLNAENFNIENCKEMTDKVQNMFSKKTTVNFETDNYGNEVDIDDPACLQGDDFKRFPTGIKFLDQVSNGGYWPGSLWVMMGAPKAGKSRWLQNMAVESYKLNYNTAYVSLELRKTIIARRMAANLYNINMSDFSVNGFDSSKYTSTIKDYRVNHNLTAKLRISEYPQSSLTVSELEQNLLRQEKIFSQESGKEFHFKVVFVDYLNLLQNKVNNNSENTYIKVKQITDDLCKIAKKNEWCIVSATQSKASYFGLDTIDMQAVSESSGLSANCDMLFGIISTSQMHIDHEQYLKILLNRVEYITDFKQKFDIDEAHMRLVQSQSEMEYDNVMLKTDNDKQQKKQFRKALKDKKEGDKSDLSNASTTDNIDALFSDMKNFKIN